MNSNRPPTGEDFEVVANWSRSYFELMHAADVGRAFSGLLRELAQLAAQPRDDIDRFDGLRDTEQRVRRWLNELADAHQREQARRSPDAQSGAARPSGTEGTLLFVYGTLKRGLSRHAALAAQTFVGPATTLPIYRMYDCGGYPGLVADPEGHAVQGELWRVRDDCLHVLDEIEGVDMCLYERRDIRLAAPHDEAAVESYFYARSIRGLPDAGTCWRR